MCKWQASFPPGRVWICAGTDSTDLRGLSRKTEAKEEPERVSLTVPLPHFMMDPQKSNLPQLCAPG